MTVQVRRTANVNVAVPPEVKEQAEDVFKYLGLNMSSAVNIFLNMCINVNGLPFEVRYLRPSRETMAAVEAPYSEDALEGPFENTEDMMRALNA